MKSVQISDKIQTNNPSWIRKQKTPRQASRKIQIKKGDEKPQRSDAAIANFYDYRYNNKSTTTTGTFTTDSATKTTVTPAATTAVTTFTTITVTIGTISSITTTTEV